ncbi:hypothetical protein [Asticcacaulis solisilvae]|uniref:hypothetical protein n=1 Tax=Asticcacaulis solisilvae TaxID=1217274 RepID=UPI003FD82289
MTVYRCMGYYIDLSKVVAVSELQSAAVYRKFAVFIANNAQQLVFQGQNMTDGWVKVARHHQWMMEAWEDYQRHHRTWNWRRIDAPLVYKLRNFHISLQGITVLSPVISVGEDHHFDVYVYGRNDPFPVAAKGPEKLAKLKAERKALYAAWIEVLPPYLNGEDTEEDAA